MRKLVEDPHLLDEFIQEQPAYSADFKALVIKLLDQQQNVEQVAQLTNVPARTRYNWLSDWNQLKKSARKPIHWAIGQTTRSNQRSTYSLCRISPHVAPSPFYPRSTGKSFIALLSQTGVPLPASGFTSNGPTLL